MTFHYGFDEGGFDSLREKGLLVLCGYRVGSSQSQTTKERQEALKVAFLVTPDNLLFKAKTSDLHWTEDSIAKYGKGGSYKRAQWIINTLFLWAEQRDSKKYSEAIREWRKDAEWFRNTWSGMLAHTKKETPPTFVNNPSVTTNAQSWNEEDEMMDKWEEEMMGAQSGEAHVATSQLIGFDPAAIAKTVRIVLEVAIMIHREEPGLSLVEAVNLAQVVLGTVQSSIQTNGLEWDEEKINALAKASAIAVGTVMQQARR